jgi:hypothetical protein
MFIHLATRIQRQVGVVNPVGRYYDRCFITLVETIHSPCLAAHAGPARGQQPAPADRGELNQWGQRIRTAADIGVGVVHLTSDAGRRRRHPARCAAHGRGCTRIPIARGHAGPAYRELVPVEHANLGPRARIRAWCPMPGTHAHQHGPLSRAALRG